MKQESVSTCDLCGSRKFKLFLNVPDRNYQTGTFTYVKCQNCKLVRLNPRPAQSEIGKYYPKAYRAYRPIKSTNRLQKFVRFLIQNNELLAKLLIKDPLYFWKDKGKILDVGCGDGAYLQILESWDWDVYGVEINRKAVNEAKKVGVKNIREGDIFSAKYPSNYFNVVRFSHVLEHVASPRKELAETRRILKEVGHVVIFVPNINSLFFHFFKSYWYPLEPPRHFYQFEPKTITNLLRSQGFRNIKTRYIQSPHTLLWSLMYLIGLKTVEKRFGLLTLPLSLPLSLLNTLKLSDILEVTSNK